MVIQVWSLFVMGGEGPIKRDKRAVEAHGGAYVMPESSSMPPFFQELQQ